MSSPRPICVQLLVILGCLVAWSAPVLAAGIDLTEVGFEFDGSPWTLGWKFSVNEPVTIQALGIYDSGQDGLAGAAQVGVWLASGGAPLVQTTVAAGTSAGLNGYFRFTPIAPTALAPGIEYIVGSYLDGELATTLVGGNGMVDPHVTVLDVRYSSTNWTGFGFPDMTDPGSEGTAFLGANFQLTPVPLPAAAWLFGSGVASLAAGVWKTRRRSQKHHTST